MRPGTWSPGSRSDRDGPSASAVSTTRRPRWPSKAPTGGSSSRGIGTPRGRRYGGSSSRSDGLRSATSSSTDPTPCWPLRRRCGATARRTGSRCARRQETPTGPAGPSTPGGRPSRGRPSPTAEPSCASSVSASGPRPSTGSCPPSSATSWPSLVGRHDRSAAHPRGTLGQRGQRRDRPPDDLRRAGPTTPSGRGLPMSREGPSGAARGRPLRCPDCGEMRPSAALLTLDDVACRLGTSLRHVRRLADERRIPIVKVGRFVRFDAHELEHWIDDHRIGVVDQAAVARAAAPPAHGAR